MKTRHRQCRYVADGDSLNYPIDLTAEDLISGNIFESNVPRVKELTISGVFGIKFYLNDTPTPVCARVSQYVGDMNTDRTIEPTWTLPTGQEKLKDFSIYSLRFDAHSIADLQQRNAGQNRVNQQILFIDFEEEVSK